MTPHQRRELRRMRDAIAIANPVRVEPRLHPSVVRRAVALSLVSDLVRSDRRSFDPTRSISPPAAMSPAAVRLVDRPRPSSSLLRPPRAAVLRVGKVAFRAPAKVAVCVRRHVRREVLMAKGIGGSRVRKPRYNYWSYVSCR